MRRSLLAILVAGVVPLGCGGQQRASTATTRTDPVTVDGRVVPIGGGRGLFLDCVGTGAPTVILEAGFGGSTHNWDAVKPLLGRTTRTCAYDRAGLGSSLARPGVHSARDELADLQALIAHAQLPPPYVVVGHSYGGLLARLYALAHPDVVRGLVLVDAVGRDETRRTLALWPPGTARAERRAFASPVTDGVDLAAGERLGLRVASLGHLPVVVLTAAGHDQQWGDLPQPLPRRFDRLWTRMQDELAALSSDHVHVVAARSGHFIQNDQPEVVVRAVTAVARAVDAHTNLPACHSLFSGGSVRCRP